MAKSLASGRNMEQEFVPDDSGIDDINENNPHNDIHDVSDDDDDDDDDDEDNNDHLQSAHPAITRGILESDTFEKEYGIEFTISCLKLWKFNEFTQNEFKKANIDRKTFLQLTAKSRVFRNIPVKEIRKILDKQKHLLEYLAKYEWKKQGIIPGETLKNYLASDINNKEWVNLTDIADFEATVTHYVVDTILLGHEELLEIKPHHFRFWALEICSTWPKYNYDVWRWYKPYVFNNKTPQGKLYERYKLKKDRAAKVAKKIEKEKAVQLAIKESKRQIESQTMIKTIIKKKSIDEEFLQKWKGTQEHRKKNEINVRILALRNKLFDEVSNIQILLHEDLKIITNKNFDINHLDIEWKKVVHYIIDLGATLSNYMKGLRDQFKTTENEDDIEVAKNLGWKFLPYCFTPTQNVDSKNKRFKPSRVEGSAEFIRWIDDEDELIPTMLDHRQKKEKKEGKEATMPYIIAIEEGNKVSSANVIVNDKRYECTTVTESIDLAFKIHITEGHKYSKGSRCIWNFLETYIYKLHITQEQLETVLDFKSKLDKYRAEN